MGRLVQESPGLGPWGGPEGSALPTPLQIRLQFSDPGLGCIGAGSFLFEGVNVLPGFRIVPAELSVVPPEEGVDHAAVPLQGLCAKKSF